MNNPTQTLIDRLESTSHAMRLRTYTQQVAAMSKLSPLPLFQEVSLGQAYEVVCEALGAPNHLTMPTPRRFVADEATQLTQDQLQSCRERSQAELRASILEANKKYGLSIPLNVEFEEFIETVHSHRLAHEPEYFNQMQEARRQSLVQEFGLYPQTGLRAAETNVLMEVNFARFISRSPEHFDTVQASFPQGLRELLAIPE